MLPFDDARRSQWLVVDRRGGRGLVARFSTPAGFFFHSVNAFEERVAEATELNLDLVMYNNMDIISSYYYDVILDRNDAAKKHFLPEGRERDVRPRLVRYKYRIPSSPSIPPSSTADEALSIPSPHIGELPAINPSFTGRSYRYVYSTPSRGLSTVMDSLCKTDLHTHEALLWAGPSGHTPGEPVFVARPGAVEEDDGVLLSVVLDGSAQRSYLLCLDARTMEEVGRAEADFAIGMGFHGVHMPKQAN
jgi:torulene dioxygenase